MQDFSRPFLIKKKHCKKAKLLFAVFCAIGAFLLAFFSVFTILKIFKVPQTQTQSFFVVALDSGQTNKSEVSEQAQTFRSRGGAGVLFFEQTFFILMSAYKTQKEAESVLVNLKTENQNFVIKKFDAKIETEENKKPFSNFLLELMDNLFNLANNLDSSTHSLLFANQTLRNWLTKTSKMYDELLKQDQSFDFLKDVFLNCKSILEYAVSFGTENNLILPFSSVIRQAEMQILLLLKK